MWRAYEAHCQQSPGRYSVWYFGDNQADADGLVELVLSGEKRATAGALWAFESDGTPLPQPGDLAVVTDWAGVAKCIIRTTDVTVVPYHEVSESFAAAEGEGDLSLAFWRQVHWPYFGREMSRIGHELTENIPVVCHRFEVVYP